MSNDEQANSDPLPYTQVDRAVKPKATLLAAMIKSTTQHALGSLVEFWDLNGDPRELEKLVTAGKRAVVLQADEVRRRFRLASGHDVDPDDLNSLGLLERTPEGYRVRGMSRYFAPVERRIQARLAASIGGKASAEARKAAAGTAQPRSASGSETVREPLKRTPKRSRSEHRSGAEAAPEASTEAESNTAVSGQRSTAAAGEKIAPDGAHQALTDALCETHQRVRGSPYPFSSRTDPHIGARNGKAVKALLGIAIAPTVLAAWERALRSDKFPLVRTLPELVTHFPHFVGRETTGPPTGAATAAATDWSDYQPGDTNRELFGGKTS